MSGLNGKVYIDSHMYICKKMNKRIVSSFVKIGIKNWNKLREYLRK